MRASCRFCIACAHRARLLRVRRSAFASTRALLLLLGPLQGWRAWAAFAHDAAGTPAAARARLQRAAARAR
eukprot:6194727-Pleurochrysis_carterae.AAC.1